MMNALIINDTALLKSLEILLGDRGYSVQSFSHALNGYSYIEQGAPVDVLPGREQEKMTRLLKTSEWTGKGQRQASSPFIGMSKNRCIALFALGIILLFAGCATTREKEAFKEWKDMESRQYGAPDKGASRAQMVFQGEHSSLPDLLSYAAAHNPGIRSAFEKWKAALEKAPQERSLPDPRVTYSYYLREDDTQVEPMTQKFALSQEFMLFGKLNLMGQMALAKADMERWNYESKKQDLFFELKKHYFEYDYHLKSISIMEKNIEFMKEMERVARVQYVSGMTPYSAEIKAQLELGKMENDLNSMKDMIEPIVGQLNSFLNRSQDAPLPPPVVKEKISPPLSEREFIPLIQASSPMLKMLDAEKEMNQTSLALAKKGYYPDLMLGVEYMHTRDDSSAGMSDSTAEPYMFMASLNIPLWFGKYRAGIREAEAATRSSEQSKKQKENELLSELKMMLYKFRDAERKVGLYRDTLLPKARESLRVAQQAFTSGKADFMDLIEAERSLLDIDLSYEKAQTDQRVILAELEMLAGKEISVSETGSKD